MTLKQQCIALYTLVRRECIRMFRIGTQVFLPPVITTTLYFLVFGSVIGGRIGLIQGYSYPTFIAPGLILMAVITNAYSNVSTSFFGARFQKYVEEMLVSPMHYGLILLGYTLSGIVRGIIVAALIYFVACFFIEVDFRHLPLTFLVVTLVAALFSQAGFTNGLLARTFDDVALIPIFVLTPLTYLGGVFYSTTMLPPIWQKISYFNPILYMVNALRQAMLGHQEVNMIMAMTIICLILLLLTGLNLFLLKKGIGLRD